ncbi:DUF1064 domain-containing protein, partial [Fructilactobacillus florum]|uniref:DUF1064 domain-containing protein n=1 Tax=Fructilactobacillus florum TaxID=640331 RepID=UPI0012E70F3A
RTNQLQKSHNKYHAKKMTIDGIKFDSKAEAQYYRLYASNSQKSVSIHESFVILDGITVNGKKRRRRRYT